jgi:hypothetical protein
MRFRWIDRLTSLEPRRAATALHCVSFEEAMLVRASATRGAPPTITIDWLCQLVQLLVAESTDFASVALLESVERCELGPAPQAGERAVVSVRVTAWDDARASLDGSVQILERAALSIKNALFVFAPLPRCLDEAELRAALRAARGEFPRPVGIR